MYEGFFGLREPPFNVTPDPRFFFTNSCYNQVFATLRYGIAERKGFIVVTGEPGTGKTTLLKKLLSNLDHNVHTAWIFDPHLAFHELFRLTLDDLGLSAGVGASRLEMLGQFYDYLVEQLGADHLVALLIDEAQDLDNDILEELRLLSNLEASGAKLLQIVLIGQPELESRLDHPSLRQLKQRIALRSRIVPLANQEVGPYIRFRLAAAGYSGKPIFVEDTIERIWHFSKGIPRIINVICDNALLIAYAKSRKSVSVDMIAEAVADLRLEDRRPKTIAPAWPRGRPANIEAKRLENRQEVDKDRAPQHERVLALPAGPKRAALRDMTESRWLGLVAALATLVWVFAVVETFSYRTQFNDLSIVREPIEKMRAAVAPFPEQIRNVLLTRSSRPDPIVTPVPENRSGMEAERAHAPRSAPQSQKKYAGGALENKIKIGEAASGKSRAAPVAPEIPQPSSAKNTDAQPNPGPEKIRFKVVDNSFVRDEPAAESEIIATLRPGTEIRLIGKRGEYFRISAFGGENIRGYVHKEDAFFEPIN